MRYFFTCKKEGNMGLHVGDDPYKVEANREALRNSLGVSKLIFMNQVHGSDVICVDKDTITPTCDAMISQSKEIGLAVMVADCIPILFYDAPTQSMAVAHAGRAGTAASISLKTLYALEKNFGVSRKTVQVYIGPCIEKCCYEVGKEVCGGLEHVLHVKHEALFLDLPKANIDALRQAGVLEKNIQYEAVCTCCSTDYFSYRREKTTGRFVGVIRL